MQQRISVMTRAVCRYLLAAGACAAMLPRLIAPAFAEPTMWVVKDADSTIYLLGTFHLMKPGMKWWSDRMEAAFKSSDELWLEVIADEADPELQALIFKYGFDRGRPLSSKLSGEDWAKTQSAATAAGLPVPAIDQMRPWLAGVTLAVAPMIKDGYAYEKGAEARLEQDAKASKKSVKTLETVEQQLLIFANLSEEGEIAFLLQSVELMSATAQYIDEMADAWMGGDSDTLQALAIEPIKADSPELYEAMFVRRNVNWTEQIATMMKGSGTSFIAVGAGHLVGEESVPAMLSERGFSVTPY